MGLIDDLITATGQTYPDGTYKIAWHVDDLDKDDSERVYSTVLNTDSGAFNIQIEPLMSYLYLHNGILIMGTASKIDDVRTAISTQIGNLKTAAVTAIGDYLAELVA